MIRQHAQWQCAENLEQNLCRMRVAQEIFWTGAESVRPGLEYHYEVSRTRPRQNNLIAQHIQWGAQRPHDIDLLQFIRRYSITQAQGIVFPNDLAEISRGSEMVVQAAIGDKEGLPTRDLSINHFADVNTRFGCEITAQFHYDFCSWKLFPGGLDQR